MKKVMPKRYVLVAILAIVATMALTVMPTLGATTASVPPIFWHSVTYYPDPIVPPHEFDADLTFAVDFGPGGSPGNNHTVEGRVKVGSGPWLAWRPWSGQWTSCDLGECIFEGAADGHYNTPYTWQARVKNTSTQQVSSSYQFTLYYIDP